jgi:predicted component of type VI protein secretion system
MGMEFQIDADLWWQEAGEELSIKTSVDLETGQCVISN